MTAQEFSSLKDWAGHFIKHKDLFERKVVKVEETSNGYRVERKDKTTVEWIINDQFNYPGKGTGTRVIACLNNKENVKTVIKAWKELVADSAITLWFVNLTTGEKWSLNPKMHDLFADKSTLEQGLCSLMDSANGVIKDEPKRKKKQSMFEESTESGNDEEN